MQWWVSVMSWIKKGFIDIRMYWVGHISFEMRNWNCFHFSYYFLVKVALLYGIVQKFNNIKDLLDTKNQFQYQVINGIMNDAFTSKLYHALWGIEIRIVFSFSSNLLFKEILLFQKIHLIMVEAVLKLLILKDYLNNAIYIWKIILV